jgi:dihydrofolate reductase
MRQLEGRRLEAFARWLEGHSKNAAAEIAMPSIAYIIARTETGVIGCNNALPWRLKTDLKRFKSITLKHVVIMGRKTYDSIGHALPQRENVVISRDSLFRPNDAKVFSTFEDAILYADIFSISEGLEKIFVVGGAVVFEKMRDHVDTAYVTEIHTRDIEGDAEFRYEFDSKEWAIEKKEKFLKSESDEYDSTFLVYKRRKAVLRKRGIREFLTPAA